MAGLTKVTSAMLGLFFDTQALLEADEGLGYAADAARQVAVDDVVFVLAEGIGYKVVAADAVDPDEETAGGVKLARTSVDADAVIAALALDQEDWDAGTGTDEATISPSKLEAKLDDKLNVVGSAPLYACRAWVVFDGTGTAAIKASGNVAALTDLGTGLYQITFETAMEDANYAWNGNCLSDDTATNTRTTVSQIGGQTKTASQLDVATMKGASATNLFDSPDVSISIHR
ncbi:MAG: hypothetical protein LCH92_08095 [Proteobacteria bacterium]|nr:hypothetical protein [Pseudomonadota bacterium]